MAKQTPDGEAFLKRMIAKKQLREEARQALTQTPEDIVHSSRLLVPWEALEKKAQHDLSPADKEKLMEALLSFCISNQACVHPDQFITACTELPTTYLRDSIEEFEPVKPTEIEEKAIKNARRMLSRARVICEQNIAVYHTKTNPQFASFYLKNRYGYIDKTENKTEVSGTQRMEIVMHLPMPDKPPAIDVQAETVKEITK